jgi:hypothetical protein
VEPTKTDLKNLKKLLLTFECIKWVTYKSLFFFLFSYQVFPFSVFILQFRYGSDRKKEQSIHGKDLNF